MDTGLTRKKIVQKQSDKLVHVLIFWGSHNVYLVCIYSSIWVVLRKGVPMCDIELLALDLHVLVANRLVQCATYTVYEIINYILLI